VPELPRFGLASRPLDDVLQDADVAVVVTVHPDLDVDRVVAAAPAVVDFRGVVGSRAVARS
jgi:hypothetical protein